ncbi:MAG: SDR family oxidoreductase [Lachnospirales bacterium]
MGRLENKVCIVTGGAQGIGNAIVETYAKEGAKVVISADMGETKSDSSNVKSVVLNVTDKEAITKLVSDVVAEYGSIDVIVNNAGITRDALCHKMTEDQWDLVIDVNLKAPHYLVAAATEQLMKQETASIINISSVSGVYGNVGQANYAATKAGVNGLIRTWTKELSRKGAKIRANSIAPGFIATPILEAMPDKVLDGMRSKILFGELGKPQDIANMALFLASDESNYLTGQVIEVSGGIKM